MSEASSAADTTATTATATTATTTATTATTTATAPNKVAFDEAELVAKTHKMFTELAKYVKGELTSEPQSPSASLSTLTPHSKCLRPTTSCSSK
jgi:hypothetical protein